jgi:hypothetical protein
LERLVTPHIHCDDESLEDGDFVFWFNNLSSIKVNKSQGENKSKPKRQKQSGNDNNNNTTLLQREQQVGFEKRCTFLFFWT